MAVKANPGRATPACRSTCTVRQQRTAPPLRGRYYITPMARHHQAASTPRTRGLRTPYAEAPFQGQRGPDPKHDSLQATPAKNLANDQLQKLSASSLVNTNHSYYIIATMHLTTQPAFTDMTALHALTALPTPRAEGARS